MVGQVNGKNKNIFMKLYDNIFKQKLILVIFIVFFANGNIQAQNNKDTILNVAQEIIESVKYCSLISIDSYGEIHARMMETFPMEKNFNVWFGTNKKSRKVNEIRNNPKVTIYYQGKDGNGYVTVYGDAKIVDDSKEKSKRFKKEWDSYFIDKNDFVLIKVIPYKLEVISYENGINGNKETWKAVNYEF